MEYKNIFVDKETYDKLTALSIQYGRTIVGQVRWMLEHYVEIHQVQPSSDAEPVPYVDMKAESK